MWKVYEHYVCIYKKKKEKHNYGSRYIMDINEFITIINNIESNSKKEERTHRDFYIQSKKQFQNDI